MENQTISLLPTQEMRIIKQIFLIYESGSKQELSIGYVMYQRKFSDNYKFKETPKEQKDFSYYLDYPKQEMYPHDEVDETIFQAIKNTYLKSRLINFSLIFNVDEEKVKRLQGRPYEQSEIIFRPSISTFDLERYIGQHFSVLRKQIKIYQDYTKESIQNIAFLGLYDLQDKSILDKVSNIEFL